MKVEQIELIERYLNNELSEQEIIEVQRQINQDPKFAEAVKLQGAFYTSLGNKFARAEQEAKLKGTLNKLGSQHFKQQKNGKVVRMLFAVAAVAAVLLVFIWSPWQQSLLDEYYSTPRLALTSRSTDQACNASKIDQFYRDKQFAAAIPFIDACLLSSPNDGELILAKGICELNTGDKKSAIASFESLEANAVFRDTGLWYGALAQLKAENNTAAITLLKQIAPESDFGSRATTLLERLK